MTRALRVVALVALLSTLARAQAPAASARSEALQRDAYAHYQAQRWAEAEAGYLAALEAWPDNARALNNLAWMLVTADDPAWHDAPRAAALAERAVALEPDEPNYLDTLATARAALDEHLVAARIERRASDLAPDRAEFGAALRRFARAGLEGAAGAARAELQVLAVLGGRRAGDVAPAALLAELDAAGEDTASALALELRARLLAALGRDAELLQALEAALATGAAAPGLRRLRGEALARLGRHAEGAAELEAAVAEAPADYDLRLQVAQRWRRAGSPAGVARVVSAAVTALDTAHPLWEGKWARRLHTLGAETLEAEAAALSSDRPALARGYRREALAHRVRAAAAWAGKVQAPGVVPGLRALGHPAADWPRAERRRQLAGEFLGQRDLPRLREVSGRLLARGGRRLAWADVDLDGDPDLLLSSGALLLNDGAGRFTRAAPACGLRGGGRGFVFADIDQDGDLDVFRAGGGSDALFRNDSAPGAPRFVDVTAATAAGLDDGHPSEGAAWGDLNGDGYPDLYVANYELSAEQLSTGTPDRLWLSDGAGRLTAAHDAIALPRALCGRGVAMADVDLDGDVDVHVSNYRLQRNLLFLNEGGALRECAAERGVAGVRQRGSYGHTIGSAWGDLDGDGDLDLVSANLAHPRFIDFSDKTMVYLQQPDGRFVDVREQVGIWFEETHSQPTLWDMDDDGDLDLYLTAVYGGRPSSLWRNRLVEDGRLWFEDVSWATDTRVFDGWGAAPADIDGDGDLDLAVAAGGGVRLFLNDGVAERPRRSVRVRLRGLRSDSWGAYATLTLQVGDRRLVRQVTLGEGTTCQREPLAHFGVGSAAGPFELEVRWPAGAVTRHRLEPGRHDIVEPWVPGWR